MEAVVVPARLEHAFVLATNMREADALELEACGMSPLEGVLYPLRISTTACAVLYDDVLGAMFGVAPTNQFLGREDRLWFLTSHFFAEKPKAFIKELKRAIAVLLREHPVLTNVIDARYSGALRLAQSFGATFGNPRPMGLKGELFVPFTIRASP